MPVGGLPASMECFLPAIRVRSFTEVQDYLHGSVCDTARFI